MAFLSFQEPPDFEPSGPSILLKNISLLMAKELYSANSKLGGALADPLRQSSRALRILSVIGAGGMGEV